MSFQEHSIIKTRQIGFSQEKEETENQEAELKVAEDLEAGDMKVPEPHDSQHPEKFSFFKGAPSAGSLASSINSRFPNAREVSETVSTKFYAVAPCLIAALLNILMLILYNGMNEGIVAPIPSNTIHMVGGILLELLLVLTTYATLVALNEGAVVYFAYLLTQKDGYSMTLVGFNQSSMLRKLGFCNMLSLNSPSRKYLSRLAIIWLILAVNYILSPFSATSIMGSEIRLDRGAVSCIIFNQEKEPVDRGFPTVIVEQGFAELIFGTALGHMRSQEPVDRTEFIMTPQIVGAVSDGDTISGPGFSTMIKTECECSKTFNEQGIAAIAQDVPMPVISSMFKEFKNISDGLVNYVAQMNETTVIVTTLWSGSSICGAQTKFVKVCRTVFNDHLHATVTVRYMTDGTPASIAIEKSVIRDYENAANITWVYESLKNILDGPLSAFTTQNTIPGVVNPLLWWTTPNLLSTDPALLEPGLETTFSILLRGGMQRTLSHHGETCVLNVVDEDVSILRLAPHGISIGVYILTMQLIICVFAISLYAFWFLSEYPFGPAIRVLTENIYFVTLLKSSDIKTAFTELCNAPTFVLWQELDAIVRVGESIQTKSDEVGHIAMGKPKVVSFLTNGRKYY